MSAADLIPCVELTGGGSEGGLDGHERKAPLSKVTSKPERTVRIRDASKESAIVSGERLKSPLAHP